MASNLEPKQPNPNCAIRRHMSPPLPLTYNNILHPANPLFTWKLRRMIKRGAIFQQNWHITCWLKIALTLAELSYSYRVASHVEASRRQNCTCTKAALSVSHILCEVMRCSLGSDGCGLVVSPTCSLAASGADLRRIITQNAGYYSIVIHYIVNTHS